MPHLQNTKPHTTMRNMSIEDHNIVEETISETAIRIIREIAPEIPEETATRITDALFENMLLADVNELNDYLTQVAQWQQRAKEGWVEEWGTRHDEEPEFISPVVWESFEQARDVAKEDPTGGTRVLYRKAKPWVALSYSDGTDI